MPATPRPALRIAVIGLGAVGSDHVYRLARGGADARVTVVADGNPIRARAVADAVVGSRPVDDVADAIDADDVDAVVLAFGSRLADALATCLELGRPVLCALPFGGAPDTALDIARRDAGSGLVEVGFAHRCDDDRVRVRADLAAGRLGTPVRLRTVRRPTVASEEDPASIVEREFEDAIDEVRFVLDDECVAVTATDRAGTPAARGVAASIRTARGHRVDVDVRGSTRRDAVRRLDIVGPDGALTIGDGPVARRDGRADAVERRLRMWVDAARSRVSSPVPSPSGTGAGAWDAYVATAVREAYARSLADGGEVAPALAARPTRRA